ncbi:Uncharacterised protein [Vibrio cholerae]|nr:Uncharacterised protein [Vibrio cholerae]
MPSSSASAPASIRVCMMASDCSGFGSPMVTKGTKAPC